MGYKTNLFSTLVCMMLLSSCSCKKDKLKVELGSKITMVKATDDNSSWQLYIDAAVEDRPGIWIDLNNNNQKDHGEAITKFGMESGDLNTFVLGSSKKVVLYGNITKLNCNTNELVSLDCSNNTTLKELNCAVNRLSHLNVTGLSMLEILDCGFNELTTLNVSGNVKLKSLSCLYNNLTALSLSTNTALITLECMSNKLSTLDLSKNTALRTLSCSDNLITGLDVSKNVSLTSLHCMKNKLTTLDVSNNLSMTKLVCVNNLLTTLDLSNNAALTEVDICRNRIAGANMKAFMRNLPLQSSASKGRLTLLMAPDGNSRPEPGDIAEAKAKNWELYELNSSGIESEM